jgi:PAS domain S-box-containing protein
MMRQLNRNERVVLVVVAAAVLFGGIAPVAAPDALGSALLYDSGVLASTLFGLAGTLRLPSERRLEWFFICAGCFCFFLGDITWDFYEHVLHQSVPLPSAGDWLYLAAYPLLLVGVVRIARRTVGIDRVSLWFDVGILAASVGLLVWEPLLADSGRSLAGALVAGAYPVFDIVILGFAAILAGAGLAQASMPLVGGAGALFIADLSFLVLDSRGGYSTGAWPDPFWVIGAFLLAAGPWFDTAEDPTRRRRFPPIASTVLVIAALVALPIDFGLSDTAAETGNEPIVRLLLRVLLLALVAARLLRQATNNEQLVNELDNTSTRLSTVVANTTEAVVFADLTGEILEWNAAAEKLFGIARADVLGRDVFTLFTRPENVAMARGVMRGLTPGQVQTIDLRLEPNGVVVAIQLQIAAVADATGRVAGFVAVARDNTQNLLARHALESFGQLEPAAALERFAFELRAFVPFDLLSLASIEDGNFRELARMTSEGDSWDRVVVAVDAAELSAGPLESYGLGTFGDQPYVLLRAGQYADGNVRVAALGITDSILLPLRDPLTNEARGILALSFATPGVATVEHAEQLARVAPELSQSVNNMIMYDRERRTAERLQELDDLREGFFALVAHEVRSPLGALVTAASVLRDHGASMDAASARDLAAGISSDARRLARLTGDLVDASRGGHGTFPCEMAPIADLGALVVTASESAGAGQRDRVRVQAAPGIALDGDADRLAQVVTNLITNGLKFSTDGVDVCLAREGDEAVLTVADHGPGIPAAQAHRVFQRFTRLHHNGNGPRPSGSGLGLFITRELVTAHHGTIDHHPTPGGGATFEVRLPCSA